MPSPSCPESLLVLPQINPVQNDTKPNGSQSILCTSCFPRSKEYFSDPNDTKPSSANRFFYSCFPRVFSFEALTRTLQSHVQFISCLPDQPVPVPFSFDSTDAGFELQTQVCSSERKINSYLSMAKCIHIRSS